MTVAVAVAGQRQLPLAGTVYVSETAREALRRGGAAEHVASMAGRSRPEAP